MATRTRSVPQIVVSSADYERLNDLADASMERLPEVAEELLSEMERAKVVDADKVPADVVSMGSTVTFTSDDGQTRTLKLVWPVDESLVTAATGSDPAAQASPPVAESPTGTGDAPGDEPLDASGGEAVFIWV